MMRKRPARIEVTLPELQPADGGDLGADGYHDAVEFRDLDLSGQEAPRCRFIESGLFNCSLDGTALRESRLTDCLLDGVRAGALDMTGSFWRDVVVNDCRFGAFTVPASAMVRVRVTGGKIDFLNARDAELTDVRFEGCRLGEVEFGGARLRRVTFADCRIERVEFSRATLHEVDLSRSQLRLLGGVDRLSGAVISEAQLAQLAPVLAGHLGLTVVPESDG
jgi:uncharacterized protein YjbI with pentapeptide repeats